MRSHSSTKRTTMGAFNSGWTRRHQQGICPPVFVSLAAAAYWLLSGCAGSSNMQAKPYQKKLVDSSDGSDWAAYGRPRRKGTTVRSPSQVAERLSARTAVVARPSVGNSVTTPLAVDGILFALDTASYMRSTRTGSKLWT
jgi:hypothetical protein